MNKLKSIESDPIDRKQRWQIELFFKWIKQNLKIKRFMGTAENAVKVQIIIAMIAYLILKITRMIMPTKRSLQQLARLVAVNIVQRKSIADLFGDSAPPIKCKSKLNPHQMQLLNI